MNLKKLIILLFILSSFQRLFLQEGNNVHLNIEISKKNISIDEYFEITYKLVNNSNDDFYFSCFNTQYDKHLLFYGNGEIIRPQTPNILELTMKPSKGNYCLIRAKENMSIVHTFRLIDSEIDFRGKKINGLFLEEIKRKFYIPLKRDSVIEIKGLYKLLPIEVRTWKELSILGNLFSEDIYSDKIEIIID